MAISKLQLVEIEFPETMSDEVLSKLVDSEKFHPEPASKFVDSVRDLSSESDGGVEGQHL